MVASSFSKKNNEAAGASYGRFRPTLIGTLSLAKCKMKILCKLECTNVRIGSFNVYVAPFLASMSKNGRQNVEKSDPKVIGMSDFFLFEKHIGVIQIIRIQRNKSAQIVRVLRMVTWLALLSARHDP